MGDLLQAVLDANGGSNGDERKPFSSFSSHSAQERYHTDTTVDLVDGNTPISVDLCRNHLYHCLLYDLTIDKRTTKGVVWIVEVEWMRQAILLKIASSFRLPRHSAGKPTPPFYRASKPLFVVAANCCCEKRMKS
jgi:hypothetical protein